MKKKNKTKSEIESEGIMVNLLGSYLSIMGKLLNSFRFFKTVSNFYDLISIT